MSARAWTDDEVRALGVRTDVETAGSILGMGKTQAYDAVKNGRFPVPVIYVGRRMIVPCAPLRRLLGIDPEPNPSTNEAAPVNAAPLTDHHVEEESRHVHFARKLRAT